jgi:hypothetical protein
MPAPRDMQPPGALIRKTSLLRDRSNSARGQRHWQNAARSIPASRTLSGTNRSNDANSVWSTRPSPACAEDGPGPISSSRCQTTRAIRHTGGQTRNLFLLDDPPNRHAECCIGRPDHTRGFHTDVAPPLSGGARRDRTDDLMLAKHALSQLSYGPNSGQ